MKELLEHFEDLYFILSQTLICIFLHNVVLLSFFARVMYNSFINAKDVQ